MSKFIQQPAGAATATASSTAASGGSDGAQLELDSNSGVRPTRHLGAPISNLAAAGDGCHSEGRSLSGQRRRRRRAQSSDSSDADADWQWRLRCGPCGAAEEKLREAWAGERLDLNDL
ncbi:uncharacterized protein A4U43_C07F16290 [Asparagus officinalis]|uniref:Uncharacterized protein n=1 Tax=Asparagus officinalis TaxID=4686 RepID=A0A5P1EFR9_ASPOF|nr:uncharacterized protein A4U43_C07F16290 [Asparagus officinalis]